jgi:hypothetical protein
MPFELGCKAAPGRPKGAKSKVVPLATFRQSLKGVVERAKDGDPEAQNLVVQAAFVRPEWVALGAVKTV